MSFDARNDDDVYSQELHDLLLHQTNKSTLIARLRDVFLRTFDLGFTSFGGPPVHFQIFHRRFVDGLGKTPWIDEQTYQELFAISQALPGPGSTKMLFNIAQVHAGIIPALFVFFMWCAPGAIAMYGLSLGVQKIDETLPEPMYGFLSGLNAAIVGIIALSAVQLSRKAITSSLTRILVLVGGCAGLCYHALWYFPLLIVMGGASTLAWESFGQSWVRKLRDWRHNERRSSSSPQVEAVSEMDNTGDIREELRTSKTLHLDAHQRQILSTVGNEFPETQGDRPSPGSPSHIQRSEHAIPVKLGLTIIGMFFAAFIILMALRGALGTAPLLLLLFNDMFLAGTIIFGGGPVVIPLLRNYVVDPGWVLPRDFLLGLAVIQALPGPNFNFAVYLGALVIGGPASSKSIPTAVGAMLAFVGIFTPGLWLSVGFQSIWQSLRERREVLSILRGMNATAVGFIFTAVYRLWEIGYLTSKASHGGSLGEEPWWLVVAATSFTAVEWFGVPPPVAIIAGGTAGLGWWSTVARGHPTQFLLQTYRDYQDCHTNGC